MPRKPSYEDYLAVGEESGDVPRSSQGYWGWEKKSKRSYEEETESRAAWSNRGHGDWESYDYYDYGYGNRGDWKSR